MTISAKELIERETHLGVLTQESSRCWAVLQNAKKAIEKLEQDYDNARYNEEEFANELQELRSQIMAEEVSDV